MLLSVSPQFNGGSLNRGVESDEGRTWCIAEQPEPVSLAGVMSKNLKISLACLILLIGFTVALPFRRSLSSASSQQAEPIESTGSQFEASSEKQAQQQSRFFTSPWIGAGVSVPVPAGNQPIAAAPREADAAERIESAPPDPRAAITDPPELPKKFAAASTARVAGPASNIELTLQPPKPTVRKHRIVDGDTLSLLARRYLGDASRFGEIVQANPEVLQDPDLLPIGKVLKIPARERRTSSSGKRDPAASHLGPGDVSALPMVSVPPRSQRPESSDAD